MCVRGPLELEVQHVSHEDIVGVDFVPHDPGAGALAQDGRVAYPFKGFGTVINGLRVFFLGIWVYLRK
jgi:hypothetical protein